LLAGKDADFVRGGRGNDLLEAGTEQGDDLFDFNIVIGGEGNDTLIGSDAQDVLIGGDFDLDKIDLFSFGHELSQQHLKLSLAPLTPVGAGNDVLRGEDGIDVLIGGHGDDVLDSGGGLGGRLIGAPFHPSSAADIDLSILNTTSFSNFFDKLKQVGQHLDELLTLGFVGNGKEPLLGAPAFDAML